MYEWRKLTLSAYLEPGLMLSMSAVNVISFNFLSLQILFTYFPNLILSNKSPGYHSGALFGVSLPLFRPKQKAYAMISGFLSP